jgi:hypothetical protein
LPHLNSQSEFISWCVQVMVQIKVPIKRSVNSGAVTAEITTVLHKKVCVFISQYGPRWVRLIPHPARAVMR